MQLSSVFVLQDWTTELLDTSLEELSSTFSLLLDSTGFSELEDTSFFSELEDSSTFTELEDSAAFIELDDSSTLAELDDSSTFAELLPAAPSLDDDFSPLPLLLDSTLPELDEDFSSLEELPSTAFSLDEDSFGSADCGACPELVEGLSVTLDDELLPGITSSLEEERVASPSAGPAGESLEPSSPQALPSNAATTTIPPRTNFFNINNLTLKYNLNLAPNQPPRD
ncbi:MAG: hypothetical protein MJY99_08735 [Fibrobacter sp.]|nr:hypothetical protein [Fibrobacter sp.]